MLQDDGLPLAPPQKYSTQVNVGSDYTDEEIDFLKAIDRYKRTRHRPHPTWSEVLSVIHALGYTNKKYDSAGKLIS